MGVLYSGRHYGYSLSRVLAEPGSRSLKEGAIYPILARLDRESLVRSEWVVCDQGPPKVLCTDGGRPQDVRGIELALDWLGKVAQSIRRRLWPAGLVEEQLPVRPRIMPDGGSADSLKQHAGPVCKADH
jgi:hypothetical protein